jgi:hypothetical protein
MQPAGVDATSDVDVRSGAPSRVAAAFEIMTTLVVLQPGYIPWLGFFDRMRRSDAFIYYDDVQFDKNGRRNCDRIKDAERRAMAELPGKAKRTHRAAHLRRRNRAAAALGATASALSAFREAYAQAPFLKLYYGELAEILQRDWQLLAELNIAAVALMCRWLGLDRRILRSSELDIAGGKSERLIKLCRDVGANRYPSGNSALHYLDPGLFAAANITLEWQDYVYPSYPQLHGATLDLLFNVGPSSLDEIARGASVPACHG